MTSKRQKNAGYPLPDVVDPGSTVDYCVTIPDDPTYREAFFGALWSLGKWWNWEKSYVPGDTRAKDAAQVWRNILVTGVVLGCGGSTDMLDFRDNPLDPCEVQYSTDGGLTWQTAFRKDNCILDMGGITIETAVEGETTITNNNITYAGDIINIAPQWAYNSVTTDISLCWAIRKFVDSICQFALGQNSENQDLLNISHFAEQGVKIFGALGVYLAASHANVPAAAAIACGMAIADEGFDILNAWLGNDKSLLEDEAAREVVACWMYYNLKGATPQWAPWTASLDDFVGGDDAENLIVDIVKEALESEDLYVNYLFLVEDINAVSASLPPCPCSDRWEHVWDFVTHGADAWAVTGAWGEWQAGIGFVAQDRLLSGYHSNLIEYLALSEPVPNCDGFEFEMICVRGGWDANLTSLWMEQPPRPIHTANSGFIWTGNPGWRHNFAVGDLSYVRMTIRSCYTQLGSLGSITITGMRLHGEGVDPFRHRITS